MKIRLILVIVGCFGVLLTGCQHLPEPTPTGGEPVSLEPPNRRPILAITVADADEVEILAQELKLKPVRKVNFTADDGQGGRCSGSVVVGVPHSKKDTAVDDGQTYDSTQH